MAVAPCKDCSKRELGCHSKCPEYIAYRKQQDEENEARRKLLETKYNPNIENIIKRARRSRR